MIFSLALNFCARRDAQRRDGLHFAERSQRNRLLLDEWAKTVGAFIPKSMLPQKTVAQDATNRMKFSIAEQVADVASELTPLKRGDILLTGAGSLGPLAIGDLVEGCIEGLESKYTVSSTLILKAQHKRKAAEAKL